MVESGAFGVAGVLYGGKIGGIVGVQFGAAQFRADRRPVELACEGPPRSLGLGDVGAIRQPEARQTIGRDPDASLAVEGDVVRPRQPAIVAHPRMISGPSSGLRGSPA